MNPHQLGYMFTEKHRKLLKRNMKIKKAVVTIVGLIVALVLTLVIGQFI